MPAAVDVAIVPKAALHWREEAACKGKDFSLFFGNDGVPLLGKAAVAGRAVCARCPVRRDCLIDALVYQEFLGLRAGYLGHELRSTLRRHGWDIAAAVAAYDAGDFYQHPRRKP
jgi:WhiB family redox-sensing transcriptional regulator